MRSYAVIPPIYYCCILTCMKNHPTIPKPCESRKQHPHHFCIKYQVQYSSGPCIVPTDTSGIYTEWSDEPSCDLDLVYKEAVRPSRGRGPDIFQEK